MELRQVRAFVLVNEERHFGRAANRLNMTQPAVTQRIHALERELGVELLTRTTRGVTLTRSGEYFLPYAVRLVQMADQAVRDLRASSRGTGGRLHVAYIPHVEVALSTAILQEFRRRFPSVDLVTSFGHSKQNIEQVDRGDVDVAFVAGKGLLPPTLLQRRVALEEMVLAVPASHRFAAAGAVDAKDLRSERLVLFPQHLNPALVEGLMSWLNRHTAGSVTVDAQEPYEQGLELVARGGRPVAVVPRDFAARSAVEGVVFRPLSPTPLFEVCAIYRRHDPSPILDRLIHVVDEVSTAKPTPPREDGELIG
ncbi:MAG TPA: LysR family transcriptional regulator [Candidatus Udaeobacter sp.]|nr:LysR family transcriptional regulator [Candidatus Udaeobacter sp.]